MQKIHEQGSVSILLQHHNELDAAVAAAYGWPANLTEEEILEKLVALNKERAAEEARRLIRWLRPEYQNPQDVQQTGIAVEESESTPVAQSAELIEWPKSLSEQAQAVQKILQLFEFFKFFENLHTNRSSLTFYTFEKLEILGKKDAATA